MSNNRTTTTSSSVAGPSKPRPPPIPIPSSRDYLSPGSSNVRTRTPTRTSTVYQEVELGVYLGKESRDTGTPPSALASVSPSRFSFRRPSVSSSKIEIQKPKSLFLANSEWRTDIVTFCSHARLDSVLGQARITHLQARKSKRPPFLHEYLLVFFTAANKQRFVARIDRLGKIGSTSAGGLLGWCAGRHGLASNTAIQQVGVYHIQDTQSGVDSTDGAWFAGDRGWGSEAIATLVTWENVSNLPEQVSHHTQTAVARDGPSPRLRDVSRLLEAILVEMPTYHLTTTNCYFMTRSSLLLLQRCFPTSFACYMGSNSGDLIPSSDLAEPVWAGLIRWYLPFVIVILTLYFPIIILAHIFVSNILNCNRLLVCPLAELPDPNHIVIYPITPLLPRTIDALKLSVHGLLDVPLPVGVLHAWMTALEVRMNDLVTRLSTQYRELERAAPGPILLVDPQPFGVAFQKAWFTFAAWCAVGIGLSLAVFIMRLSNPLVRLILFVLCVITGVLFNFRYSDGNAWANPDDVLVGFSPEARLYEPEPDSTPETEPVPSSSAPEASSQLKNNLGL